MTARPDTSPVLIIVSGLPGAGKSTLSQRLADHFALPLLQKDMIKETLCDILECRTLSQSQRYGHASMILLYQLVEAILKRGQPCLIESTFHPILSTQDLLKLQQHCLFFPLQIHCHAEMSVLAERVKRRWESGQRHYGHMEHLRTLNPTPPLAPDSFLPLPLGGHTIEVDTTDIETLDYVHLLAQIQSILGD